MKNFLFINSAFAICIHLLTSLIATSSERFCDTIPNVLFRLDDAGAYGTEVLSMDIIDTFIDLRLPILVGLIPFPEENILNIPSEFMLLEKYYTNPFLNFLSRNEDKITIAMHGINHSVKESGLNQLNYPDSLIANASKQFFVEFKKFKDRKIYIAPWNHASDSAFKTALKHGFAEYHTSTKNHIAAELDDMQIIPSSMSLRHFLNRGLNRCFDENVIIQFHPYDFDTTDKRSYITVKELREQLKSVNVNPLTSDELSFRHISNGSFINPMTIRKYVPSFVWLSYNDVIHSGYVDIVFVFLLLNVTLSVFFLLAKMLPIRSPMTVVLLGLSAIILVPIKLKLFLTYAFLGFLISVIINKFKLGV